MADRDDLRYTADGIRDRAHYRGDTIERELHVQATMQEETAIAVHRLAEATERLADALEPDSE